MTDRFDDEALLLVPVGRAMPGRTELRKNIAHRLRTVYATARKEQLEEKFPEIEEHRRKAKAWDVITKDWAEREAARRQELKDWEHRLTLREDALFVREQALKELLVALDDYEAWQNGEGDVDEIAARYASLRASLKLYRERTQK